MDTGNIWVDGGYVEAAEQIIVPEGPEPPPEPDDAD